MAALYETVSELIELQQMLDSDEYDEDMILSTLEGVEMEFKQKANAIGCLIRNNEIMAQNCKAEAQRFTDRSKGYEKKVESLQKYLLNSMKISGQTKFDTEQFAFGINKGRGTVVIDDEEAVPFEFITSKVVNQVNKTELNKFLKEHEDCKFAHLEFNDSLKMK